MKWGNLWGFNFLGILTPTSLPIPETDDQLLATYSCLMEIVYIGKASNNLWSPGTLTRPNMSEWQLRVMGNYSLTYRIPPFTTSIQLYSMGIIWVPLVLQPILATLKGHGILISAITSHAKHLSMGSFAYNIAALTIWLPTYSPTEASPKFKPLPIVTHEKHRTGAIMKELFWVPRPLGGEYCVVLSFLARRGEHFTLACLSLQL